MSCVWQAPTPCMPLSHNGGYRPIGFRTHLPYNCQQVQLGSEVMNNLELSDILGKRLNISTSHDSDMRMTNMDSCDRHASCYILHNMVPTHILSDNHLTCSRSFGPLFAKCFVLLVIRFLAFFRAVPRHLASCARHQCPI